MPTAFIQNIALWVHSIPSYWRKIICLTDPIISTCPIVIFFQMVNQLSQHYSLSNSCFFLLIWKLPSAYNSYLYSNSFLMLAHLFNCVPIHTVLRDHTFMMHFHPFIHPLTHSLTQRIGWVVLWTRCRSRNWINSGQQRREQHCPPGTRILISDLGNGSHLDQFYLLSCSEAFLPIYNSQWTDVGK